MSSEIKQEPSSVNKKPSTGSSGGKKGRESELWGYGETRHAQYIMHFPVDTDVSLLVYIKINFLDKSLVYCFKVLVLFWLGEFKNVLCLVFLVKKNFCFIVKSS